MLNDADNDYSIALVHTATRNSRDHPDKRERERRSETDKRKTTAEKRMEKKTEQIVYGKCMCGKQI